MNVSSESEGASQWRQLRSPECFPALLVFVTGLVFLLVSMGALSWWLAFPGRGGQIPETEICVGAITIGMSVLLCWTVMLAMGPKEFSALCRAPQHYPWMQRGFGAGALSPMGAVLIASVVGVSWDWMRGSQGLLTCPALLVQFNALAYLLVPHGPQSWAAAVAAHFFVWYAVGFLTGALFRRRWVILTAWPVLAGCQAGLTIALIVRVLSH